MKRGERLEEGSTEFSVVQRCPKCGEIGFLFREGRLACTKCGFTENIHSAR